MKRITGRLATKNQKWYAVLNLYDTEGNRKQKWMNLDLDEKRGTKTEANYRLEKLLMQYNTGDLYLQDTMTHAERERKAVISYLTLLETNPEALSMPVGIFSSGANGQAKANPYLLIDSKKFVTFLHNVWSAIPDALSVKEASKLLGYSCGAVDHWISKGRLKAVRYRGSYLIPKDALINFLADTSNYSICQKSEKHLELICGYISK